MIAHGPTEPGTGATARGAICRLTLRWPPCGRLSAMLASFMLRNHASLPNSKIGAVPCCALHNVATRGPPWPCMPRRAGRSP